MSESAFIASVESYLMSVGVTPAPASLGVAEPSAAGALPAVVISLEETRAAHSGVGERTQLMTGALAWTATIDLANAVLAGAPPLALLAGARTHLTLPHGGLVRSDGTSGALAAADISIKVGAVARTLVAAAPAGDDFAIDPTVGAVTFGAALPLSGTLTASYFVGQWEQRLSRIAGTLRVDVCALSADDTRGIADQILAALASARARAAMPRLNVLAATSVSSVGAPDLAFASSRRRALRFGFDFESEINEPDSSGGVIAAIPLRGPLPPPKPDDTQFLA